MFNTTLSTVHIQTSNVFRVQESTLITEIAKKTSNNVWILITFFDSFVMITARFLIDKVMIIIGFGGGHNLDCGLLTHLSSWKLVCNYAELVGYLSWMEGPC